MLRPTPALYLTLRISLIVTVCLWGAAIRGDKRGQDHTVLAVTISLVSPQIASGCSESHRVTRLQDFEGQVVQVRDTC